LRRRLLARGAARVAVTPLHLPDWLAMSFAGMGPATLRVARTIAEARRVAPEPLLVVAHSAGGILARLAVSREPLDGRRVDVAAAVAGIVTLGTPHRLSPLVPWRHAGVRATEHLAEVSAGAQEPAQTGYLTVGSTFASHGQPVPTHPVKQGVGGLMRMLVGMTPDARGDGIVEDARSRLPDVPHVALQDVLHGVVGGPWYGDANAVDAWWPAAVETWRRALESAADAQRLRPGAGSSPGAPRAHPR
jgi:hypothetical protein